MADDSEVAEPVLHSPSHLPASTSKAQEVADAQSDAEAKGKVIILLKATGDAPIMRQKRWMVEPDKPVTWVVQFIRRRIKLPPTDSLFVHVSQAFSPSPDQTIGNLLECFGTEDKLVLNYCRTQAWG